MSLKGLNLSENITSIQNNLTQCDSSSPVDERAPIKAINSFDEFFNFVMNTLELQRQNKIRNLNAFKTFIHQLPLYHGLNINFSEIAKNCHITGKTVKEYFNLLLNLNLGFFIFPYDCQKQRQIIFKQPRFYLNDCHLINQLKKQDTVNNQSIHCALRHQILINLKQYHQIQPKIKSIHYWQTKNGINIDFVINEGQFVIQVLNQTIIQNKDLKALKIFMKEHKTRYGITVCQIPKPRKLFSSDNAWEIYLLPVNVFLEKLWQQEIFK